MFVQVEFEALYIAGVLLVCNNTAPMGARDETGDAGEAEAVALPAALPAEPHGSAFAGMFAG